MEEASLTSQLGPRLPRFLSGGVNGFAKPTRQAGVCVYFSLSPSPVSLTSPVPAAACEGRCQDRALPPGISRGPWEGSCLFKAWGISEAA